MSIHDIPDEVLRRGDISCTVLCEMLFLDNPKRWWMGYGPLTTGGQVYEGTGDFIQISELKLTYGMSAGMARFTIPSPSAEMVALSDNQEEQVNNQLCRIHYQLFVDYEEDGVHRGSLVGDPVSIFTGKMRDMYSSESEDSNSIELEAYGILSRQGKPPYGRWNDADQRRRYPGDAGFGLLPSLKNKSIVWVPGT